MSASLLLGSISAPRFRRRCKSAFGAYFTNERLVKQKRICDF